MKKKHSEPIGNGAQPSDSQPRVEESVDRKQQQQLYIVGIGGSAGGLEAFERFFVSMPSNSGAAFVVIQHLDPVHKALMPEILQRSTTMTVTEIEDGMKAEPNHIHVLPPNRDVTIQDGYLRLVEPPKPRGIRDPVDVFFKSLAADQGENAVGIIVSGMGSDGTLGVQAIKQQLGLVLVQDPNSAKYDSMPRSAIRTGLVDYVAPVDELPGKLLLHMRHAARETAVDARPAGSQPGYLRQIISLLRAHTGHDFSLYKRNTLYRRIERRASLYQLRGIAEYVGYLSEHPDEINLLFKDLLIGVTSFFRDPGAFTLLRDAAIPKLLDRKTDDSPFRVWVPGCSTGEEAYSVAITLIECLSASHPDQGAKIQIFASDIDVEAIDIARKGIYPAAIASDVPPERLERFFVRTDTGYQVKKEIREMVVFAIQNLVTNPPFTRLDLISCRNLLIYFSHELQHKILPLFHYALNPGGVLFLGSSETITGFTDLFATVDNKARLFRRKESPGAMARLLSMPPASRTRLFGEPPVTANGTEIAVPEAAQRELLEKYAPPAVVVNDRGDILHISGRTGKYLELPPGQPDMNVFAMVHQGLKYDLERIVIRAASEKAEAAVYGVRMGAGSEAQRVNLIASPLADRQSGRQLVMIAFQDVPAMEVTEPAPAAGGDAEGCSRCLDLENELRRTRDYLQTVIEEMETSQEELRSTNEELQSANEELQSMNEELTTSQEELQSLNEELITVNNELQTKNDELTSVNNDIVNLLDSTEIATIFTDKDLRIRRFTPSAAEIINIRHADIGRPFDEIVGHRRYERLLKHARQVLEKLTTEEFGFRSMGDRWFTVRVMPYRTVDMAVDGIVITFSDITVLKQFEDSLRESETRFRTLVDSMDDIVFTLDRSRGDEMAYGRWLEQHGFALQDFAGKSIREVLGPDQSALHEDATRRAYAGETVTYEWSAKAGGKALQIQTSLSPIRDAARSIVGIVGVGRDITERKRIQDLSIALNEINTTMRSTMDFEELMSKAAEESAGAMGVDSVGLAVREDGQWLTRYVRGFPLIQVGDRFGDDDFPHMALAAREKSLVVVNDVLGNPASHIGTAELHDIGAEIAVPLFVGSEAVAVLLLAHHGGPVVFSEAEIDFARKLGASVSLALENVRLYQLEREAKVSEEDYRRRVQRQNLFLQEALIPTGLTVTEGYTTAARFVPAGVGEHIGGDFYDVFRTEDGRTAILIGDVSGKGVAAASLAAAARSTARAFAYDLSSPAAALAHANAVICGQNANAERFVTVFLAILDPRTGELAYSSAGHPPPVLGRADGTVEFMEGSHMVMGVMENAEYREQLVHMQPGDKAAFYTDGISEAHQSGAMLESEGIADAVSGCAGCTAEELVDALFTAANRSSEGQLQDDAAVVVIERVSNASTPS